MDMSDKRLAVVTGAGRGIGRAIALRLMADGLVVAGLDLSEDTLKETAKIASEKGFEFVSHAINITDTAKLTETLESLAGEYGSVSVLVNNAGITRDKLMMQMDEEDYDILMSVNLRAAFMASKVVLRGMVRKKFGRIINISSVAGVIGQAGSANYAASKAGLIGMSKSIAREVGKKNVTANCIAPGFIQTEMTDVLPDAVKDAALGAIPARRFGKPEDIANTAAFLASEEAGYITGQVLCVDGGMAM